MTERPLPRARAQPRRLGRVLGREQVHRADQSAARARRGRHAAGGAARARAVAAATNLSNSPTVAEVQSIVDLVNAVDAVNASPEALDAILEDSASPDGAANADGAPVTAEQLDAVAEGVDPALEAEYRAAVAAATDLSNPPTVEEVQALIDAVNATADETLDAVLETRPRSNKPDQKTQTKKASA